ncbi:DNA repair protein RAD51 homolog 4 isoform X2 [Moschus berezovskii]|uniref:DNA repair protein RAD51 homolog 4 isoform X2 n=1 Tax=Moschus berezovskii TaxID=68408 RepID=UPI002444492D|nr:DNA repair protein RAD51 homolog 4 isoform X2 [Moschus berezovskii]
MGVLRAGLCPGLTQDMVQLLQSRGIKTVVDLVSADLEEVAQKCGLSYKALVALRRVLLAQFSAFPFNGADLYEELKTSTAILSTGIGSLDKLLDAGLYTGEVTEIIGAPGSGKTQVCLCVAANVAHGLQQNVLYIDSNGGLTASRILQLLQARTLDEEEQLSIQRVENRPVRQSPSPSVPESLCRGRSSPEDPGGACVWHLPDAGRAAGPARRCVPTGQQLFRNSEGGGCGLRRCGGRPPSGRSAEGRLGLDDAAGARAEDLGPGPQCGSAGDQSHDPRQGQRAAQTCPGTLLELCAQHPDSPGQHPRLRISGQPACGVSDQIPPSANRLPGDGGLRELGDPSVPGRSQRTVEAEPSVPGKSHMMVLLMGEGTGRKAPNSPAQ